MPSHETGRRVIEERRDDDGLLVRSLHTYSDGSLAIQGHDLGAGVERFFGWSEYEFSRRFSAAETRRILDALELPGVDPLEELAGRFESTHALEQYAQDLGIEGAFWSRVGD